MQVIMRMVFNVEPCPASRPRVSRWSTYYPKRYTQFKEDMKALTSEMDSTPSKKLISVVDDRQVVEVRARKRYSNRPNIIFAMTEIGE